MTTKVTVAANHGWPVKVTGVKPGTRDEVAYGGIVAKNTHQDFFCHSGMDLIVHELQPDEIQTDETAPSAETATTPA